MASTKNSQNNPYVFKTLDQLKYIQMTYFSTGSNNAQSWKQKMEIIHLICFLTQKLNEKDPNKYPDAYAVLETVFNVDFTNTSELIPGYTVAIRSFAAVCSDLMWGTTQPIEKPEGYSNATEIKNKLISYFNDEWAPF